MLSCRLISAPLNFKLKLKGAEKLPSASFRILFNQLQWSKFDATAVQLFVYFLFRFYHRCLSFHPISSRFVICIASSWSKNSTDEDGQDIDACLSSDRLEASPANRSECDDRLTRPNDDEGYHYPNSIEASRQVQSDL